MSEQLFTPCRLGDLTLSNRFVMSPMTRSRCPDGAPTELTAEYYAQRAEAGLIIGEATRVSQQATGYVATPGIYSEEQVAGWKLVTDAVHAKGSKIFCQLWHVGRVSHKLFQPNGAAPVAPSSVMAPTKVFGPEGLIDTSEPRALELDEISEVISQFRSAAENAKRAGFDGVEIHAANGYLIHQFLSKEANQRSDRYGGSLENRMRFLFEVTEAISEIWSVERIGVRLGPQIPIPGISDNDSWELYEAIALGLKERGVGYLHICELLGDHPVFPGVSTTKRWAPRLKNLFDGTVIANGGLTGETAEEALRDYADLASFGIPFLANPDLPTRIRLGVDWNEPRMETLYGGGEAGYTDYPKWEQTLASELSEFTEQFTQSAPPEKLAQMNEVMSRVLSSGIEKKALGIGEKAPDFELKDSHGKLCALSKLLESGPVVLSFYRGGWCPYCNLELRALHDILPQIKAANGHLVAVTPELPDFAKDTSQQQEIDFQVLSDIGNQVARQFGLVHKIDAELRELYLEFGIDLETRNGDGSDELPVPATYVIDSEGVIRYAFAKADHSKRAEPQDVLSALVALKPLEIA